MRTIPKSAFVAAGIHLHAPDPQVPELRFVGQEWALRSYVIAGHSHDTWEFYLQAEGETTWEVGGATYRLAPRSFIAVPPATPHRMVGPPQARHQFFFAAVEIDTVLRRHPGLEWPRGLLFASAADGLFGPFRQLLREGTRALPHRAIGLRLALDLVVVEASRLGQRGEDGRLAAEIAGHPAVRHARELLEEQPGRAWRLGDLARLCGLSPFHLARRFAAEAGLSPHQYLLRQRVERAKELLAGSDLAVTDLAQELGFSSSQHFARTFKRATGETARQFRRRSRTGR